MPKTAFEQTPLTLVGVAGADPLTGSENPDFTNGNSCIHNNKTMILVVNNSADHYVTFQPVVQRTIAEDTAELAVANPAAVQVPKGEMRIFGPYTAGNFRKSSDGTMEMLFAVEPASDLAEEDIEVRLIQHP